VAARNGVAKGTFFHHFGDRASYLLALHREFHERLISQIQAAIDGLAPGRGRMTAVAHTYLDGCLRDRGVRALLLEARAEHAVTDEIAHRNHASAELCKADFVALKRPHPYESAQLWVGMVAEAALIEHQAAQALPAVRSALEQFLNRRRRPPAYPKTSDIGTAAAILARDFMTLPGMPPPTTPATAPSRS
jgi:TetR/AcrR family transcriptional regulator, transcriptional repressor for nem operon